MSIIMAVGNRHKLILASDGRVSDIDNAGNHVVLDEKFKKIFRLSSSVYVLIAGNRSQCMQIIRRLQCEISSIMMPQVCTETINHILRNHMISAEKELNVRMIIAGLNFLKQRELYTISADKDGIEKEKIPLNDNVIYVAKGDINEDEADYFYPILNVGNRDIKLSMKLCIAEAARRNKSVNDMVFFEEL